MMKSLKKALRRIVFLTILIVVLLFSYLYSTKISHTLINVKNRSYTSSNLPNEFNGFKIGFISDLYISETSDIDRLEKIIDKLNKQNCDLIIFGGDLYESQIFEETRVSEILSTAKAEYGKFAILGEKDFIDLETSSSIIENGGFELLRNETRTIYYNNQTISLIGLESNSDISSLATSSFTVVAVHEPDYFAQLQTQSMDLQISGHTNGGYVYIPFYGGLHKPVGGSIYQHGVYKENGRTLIVSNGLGTEKNQEYRFLSTPEILVVTLKSQ